VISSDQLARKDKESLLETQIQLVLLSDLTNQALKRKLAEQQLSGLLETADLTQSDSA
jgi:hypothetical protein